MDCWVDLQNPTVLDQFFHGGPGGGHADLGDFVGVHPDFASSAFEDACCESLL